ncbi:MAG: membrane protein, partial [Candidatus Azotimanducaceae bacterium]
ESLLNGKLRRLWDFIRYLQKSFAEDNCQSTAAALTYQTLFALVPSLSIAYLIFESFSSFQGLSQQFEEFIFSNIVPENAGVVQEYLVSFSSQTRNLSIPSGLMLLLTAFLMLFTIESTFNQIWQVREPRHGAQRFLMYWAVLTLSVPFVVASIFTTTYIGSLPFISDVSESTRGLHFVPILLGTGLLTLVYVIVPNCYVRVSHAAAGAAFTSVAFEISKVLFTEIMAKSNLEAIYGTFAAVPLFLIWLYISWTLVLLGAEVVKSLGIYRFEEEDVEAPLFQVVLILELFYLAHRKGEVIRDQDIRQHTRRIHLELWPEIKAQLMEMGLIRSLDRGGMILAKDLNEVSVWDLYQTLNWRLPPDIKGEHAWEKTLSSQFSELYKRSSNDLQGDLETLFKEGR